MGTTASGRTCSGNESKSRSSAANAVGNVGRAAPSPTAAGRKVRQARCRRTTSKNSGKAGAEATEAVDVHDPQRVVECPRVERRCAEATPEALDHPRGHGPERGFGVVGVDLVEVHEP